MPEPTSVEIAKLHSRGLRGNIAATLADPARDGFEEDDRNLLKFHGTYQQKYRDKSMPQAAIFLVRGRIPGGRLNVRQYLAWDALATTVANGTLRLTTRQTFQLHGVSKDNLRTVMQAVHDVGLTTTGSCGDVVRNVTQALNPWGDPALAQLDALATLLSDHFRFQSSSYPEIWLDGVKVELPGAEAEPFYGTTYLPRKFKMAVTLVGNNSVDLYTNDLAYAATLGEDGRIDGAFLFAGGGMGMTHNKPETYPRLADQVGWIPASLFLAAAEAAVAVHRDFGDRTNRKHARLKYVIQEQGLEWFRSQVEERMGARFEARALPAWNTPSNLGWMERIDGTWALGLHVLAGRLQDVPGHALLSAVRELVERFGLDVQLTADQDIVLLGISAADRPAVEALLRERGIDGNPPSLVRARALACPSLPTCGLAMAEAERVLDSVLRDVEQVLERHGLSGRPPVLRMTGCPNGCTRPYAAEVALVGQAVGRYALFLGGNREGTRLARLWRQKVTLADFPNLLDGVCKLWKQEARPEEHLGDWVERTGWEKVKEQLETAG